MASYFRRGSLPMYMDRGYLDLGVVSNVGPWGWQPANATFDPDTIRLRMLVKATNHSLATPGSTHSVTLGLFINDQRLLVTSVSLQVEADAIIPNVTVRPTSSSLSQSKSAFVLMNCPIKLCVTFRLYYSNKGLFF